MNFNWFSLLYYQKTNTIIQILRAISQPVLQGSRSWALEPFPSRITVSALLNERRFLPASLEQNLKIKIKYRIQNGNQNPFQLEEREEKKPADYSVRFSHLPIFALNNVINLCITIFTLHFPIRLIFRWNHCHIRALDRITVSFLLATALHL